MNIHRIESPKTMEEAYHLLQADDRNQIMGGGAWTRLTNRDVETMITLDHLGLNSITETPTTIEIGAMTTLRDIELSPIIHNQLSGILSKAVAQIMGIQIRNIATIGGSIIGKYSFSDILPVLLVMKTSLRFYHQGVMSLEDFVEQKKHEKDILLQIIIEKEKGNGYFHKASKTVLDFSLINIAIAHTDEWRIQVGARPGFAKPAINAMKFLNNCNVIGEDELQHVTKLVFEEVSISSNAKAAKEYRQDLLKAYLKRGLKEVM